MANLTIAHCPVTGPGGDGHGQLSFPTQQPGVNYLTEGGQETEIMYKYGFDLPHFAMFPLLDNPRAMTELRGMYGRYLDTAARHGFGVIVGGLDYRASPDWGSLLGYSREALADFQLRAIDFLREVAAAVRGPGARAHASPASSARAATRTRRTARSPRTKRRNTTANSSPTWPVAGRRLWSKP